MFEKVAAQRAALGAYENLHFAGNFVTGAEIAAAINKVTPSTYKVVGLPWSLFQVLGIFDPMMREILTMRYLWQQPHQLVDPKLDAILGPDFGTPFERAIAETIYSLLPEAELETIKMRRAA